MPAKKSKQSLRTFVTTALTAGDNAALTAIALDLEMTKTSLMRTAIRNYIRDHYAKNLRGNDIAA